MKRYKKLGIKATDIPHIIQYCGLTESGIELCETLQKTNCSSCIFNQRTKNSDLSICCEKMLNYLTDDIF